LCHDRLRDRAIGFFFGQAAQIFRDGINAGSVQLAF